MFCFIVVVSIMLLKGISMFISRTKLCMYRTASLERGPPYLSVLPLLWWEDERGRCSVSWAHNAHVNGGCAQGGLMQFNHQIRISCLRNGHELLCCVCSSWTASLSFSSCPYWCSLPWLCPSQLEFMPLQLCIKRTSFFNEPAVHNNGYLHRVV